HVIAANPGGPPTPAQVELFKALYPGGPTDIAPADADKIQNRADRDALAAIKRKIDAFKAASPFAPPRAHVLADSASPFQPYVFLRGNQNNRGPTVPRQAPAIVAPNRKPFAEVFKLDPDNRLLSHQNHRRLDFESLRDSLLAVSGKLDTSPGGKPVDLFKAPFSTRRSIYGLIDRTSFSGTMRAFDVASPDQ